MLKNLVFILGLFFLGGSWSHAYVPKEGNVYAVLGPAITQTQFESGRPAVRYP